MPDEGDPATMKPSNSSTAGIFTITCVSVIACLVVPAATATSIHSDSVLPLYKRADAPIAQRADDLLTRMTTEELILQTYAPYGVSPDGQAYLWAEGGLGGG